MSKKMKAIQSKSDFDAAMAASTEKLIVVAFHSPGCKKTDNMMGELQTWWSGGNFSGHENLDVYLCDSEAVADVSAEQKVHSTPAFFFYSKNQKLHSHYFGTNFGSLQKMIQDTMASLQQPKPTA